jgi:hypothetical protein
VFFFFLKKKLKKKNGKRGKRVALSKWCKYASSSTSPSVTVPCLLAPAARKQGSIVASREQGARRRGACSPSGPMHPHPSSLIHQQLSSAQLSSAPYSLTMTGLKGLKRALQAWINSPSHRGTAHIATRCAVASTHAWVRYIGSDSTAHSQQSQRRGSDRWPPVPDLTMISNLLPDMENLSHFRA